MEGLIMGDSHRELLTVAYDALNLGKETLAEAEARITQLEAEKADAVEGIQQALCCTPLIRHTKDGLAIEYDCGDPWGILRATLTRITGEAQ
jgi:hypothetical protein